MTRDTSSLAVPVKKPIPWRCDDTWLNFLHGKSQRWRYKVSTQGIGCLDSPNLPLCFPWLERHVCHSVNSSTYDFYHVICDSVVFLLSLPNDCRVYRKHFDCIKYSNISILLLNPDALLYPQAKSPNFLHFLASLPVMLSTKRALITRSHSWINNVNTAIVSGTHYQRSIDNLSIRNLPPSKLFEDRMRALDGLIRSPNIPFE